MDSIVSLISEQAGIAALYRQLADRVSKRSMGKGQPSQNRVLGWRVKAQEASKWGSSVQEETVAGGRPDLWVNDLEKGTFSKRTEPTQRTTALRG